MRDLWIHDDDLIVATHGRAFWILDDIAPLREASAALANSAHLFAPAPAYRVQRDTNTDTPLPPDEPAAANPPDGAIVDYYLPASASCGDARDSGCSRPPRAPILQHRQARSDRGGTAEAVDSAVLGSRTPRQLSTAAGMHRWVWDLALSAARVHAPRLSNRGDSARHAALSAGADGSPGKLHGAAHGRWENSTDAAHCEDGSAREDVLRSDCRRNSRPRRRWLRF